jgi:hypothetical protein
MDANPSGARVPGLPAPAESRAAEGLAVGGVALAGAHALKDASMKVLTT